MSSAGQIVNTSKSGGLIIREYWGMLFRANEESFRQGRFAAVMTDSDLIQAVRRAFPGRDTETWNNVKKIRAHYNRGYDKGAMPVYHSYRYERQDGQVVRTSARGKPLSPR